MPSYSVRAVIKWDRRPGQKKRNVYEERIIVWNAESLDAAIDEAEKEAIAYAAKEGFEALDMFQGYWMFKEIGELPQGTEVFSLLRESDLPADLYLDTFFDAGTEHQGEYDDSNGSEEAE